MFRIVPSFSALLLAAAFALANPTLPMPDLPMAEPIEELEELEEELTVEYDTEAAAEHVEQLEADTARLENRIDQQILKLDALLEAFEEQVEEHDHAAEEECESESPIDEDPDLHDTSAPDPT